jgi:hypothetical protein
MRMWNSSKDGEDRPNKLIGQTKVLDTLITYIPPDSVQLATDVVIQPAKKKQNAKCPRDDQPGVPQLLYQVCMGRSDKRAEDYTNWIRTGMIAFNEGLPCDLWDSWSKKSSKYTVGACETKWKTFTKGNLTAATWWKE